MFITVNNVQAVMLNSDGHCDFPRDLITEMCVISGIPLHVCETAGETAFECSDCLESIVETAKEHMRMRLLVCGCFLDNHVTAVSLRLLERGMDVFLVRDLIVAQEAQHAPIFDSRLTQAGAVQTTFRQVLFELLSSTEHIQGREELMQLFRKCSNF